MEIETSIYYSKHNIKGLYIINPKKHEDNRGFFLESWNNVNFNKLICENINFIQDNHSSSIKGVLRGLHYQLKPYDQGKLVRCIKGEIYDVAVDIRIDSKTFGKWCGVYLNENNMKQYWIPSGFAHGFIAITKTAEVIYKSTKIWKKDYERYIKWDDEDIGIDWKLNKNNIINPILSKKDNEAQSFKQAIKKGEVLQ